MNNSTNSSLAPQIAASPPTSELRNIMDQEHAKTSDKGRSVSHLNQAKPTIVAVDGPAGSGKSSICAQVCARLGWTYINTGAIYRAVGLLASEQDCDLDDDQAVANYIGKISLDLRWDHVSQQIWFRDRNLTPLLASEEAGRAASKVAKLPRVRLSLLPLQRHLTLAAPRGAIVDGRDIGTVVFPDADLKIFLTASLEERSRRRLSQLSHGAAQSEQENLLEEIKKNIAGRDRQDAGRGVAPLKQAADAVVLDTSTLNVDEVVEALLELFKQHHLVRS